MKTLSESTRVIDADIAEYRGVRLDYWKQYSHEKQVKYSKGFNKKILDKIIDTVTDYTSRHKRVLGNRFTVNNPPHGPYCISRRDMTLIMQNVKRNLNNRYNDIDLKSTHVVEQSGNSDRPHFHITTLSNNDAIRSGWPIFEELDKQVAKRLNLSTYDKKRRNSAYGQNRTGYVEYSHYRCDPKFIDDRRILDTTKQTEPKKFNVRLNSRKKDFSADLSKFLERCSYDAKVSTKIKRMSKSDNASDRINNGYIVDDDNDF